MFKFINKEDKLNQNQNSLTITYPRTVNIIFGHYPFPELINHFIIEIKNNLDLKMENYTHVKGGMTDWNYFKDKKDFINFMTYVINKHQTTQPEIFKFFLEKFTITNAWGNEIKPNDNLTYHDHTDLHGILYLTKGCELHLPELNLKINPHPGDYYIFPPKILHGFDKYEGQTNRYSLIFNIGQGKSFEFNKKINLIKNK